MISDRPRPEAFLERLRQEAQERPAEGGGRGRLKIFFGFSAGVGKTCAMLETAAKLQESGLEVVIGYVETHGRPETASLLDGFEILPRANLEYKNRYLEEFDIDCALARKPSLILVDELAHTNVPGSRHAKRWQDIQELLEAGIDVFSTLNVQHIESMHDVVGQITGIYVQERVPDSLLDAAQEIELIDLAPDELLERLEQGKVYLGEKAQLAKENFFRKGNLIALRELALRYTAQHVDKQMLSYRQSHMITATWPAAESILVCVSPSPLSVRLVRAARRMSDSLKCRWAVVSVETPAYHSLKEADRTRLLSTLKLAEDLGAEVVELSGTKVAEEVTAYARSRNFSKIVIGKPSLPRWREILRGSLVDDIVRASGDIDVYVISGDNESSRLSAPSLLNLKSASRPGHYGAAFLAVLFTTFTAYFMRGYFELSNIVMVYILAVVVIAVNFGRGPSVLASVLSVAAFDFFFVPPYLTFAVSDTQYLITFAVMLVIALVISTLTSRVRLQAQMARKRERRTASLYALSRELSAAFDLEESINIGLKHICELFACRAALIMHEPQVAVYAGPGEGALADVDEGVSIWAYKNKQAAGLGTRTLPGATALYLPLCGADKAIGVLAVAPRAGSLKIDDPESFHLLEIFANQMAVALERAVLSRENSQAQVLVRSEQLRSSLLSSVSHDLRTPLATIAGAASSIVEGSEKLDLERCKLLAGEIYSQSERLNRLVGNLLYMTRLEAGALSVNLERHVPEELIGNALVAYSKELSGRQIVTRVDDNLPLVQADSALIQQVLINLLENAIKYAPEDKPITVRAYLQNEEKAVVFCVDDCGPGVAVAERALVFEKFYRTGSAGSVKSGVGLGLSICASIVEAHGGRIWLGENADGGASFRFTLRQSDLK